MIAMINTDSRYQDEFDDSTELDRFERFTYRRHREFPVRSQAAQTRARMRSRHSAAGRHKSRSTFNGINRRGRGKLLNLTS